MTTPSCCTTLLNGRNAPAQPRQVYANDAARNRFPDNRITNTKYTWWNFVPKNLMEQFSRPMNQYFLFIACLQLWSTITPVNPATTWGPLIIIFGVTAIKELADDLGRAKSDKQANSRPVVVVRNGAHETIPSSDIRVGDIVKLSEDDEVPCDLVLLSSSEADGTCMIQTTNLDGESNLKARIAIAQTKHLGTPANLSGFRGVVLAPAPDPFIYKFDAQLRVDETSNSVLSLSSDQLVLQATHIRSTQWAYGVAVYTGNETKFGNNKKVPTPKWTKTDRFINQVSMVVFAFQLVLVVIFGIIGDVWAADVATASPYLDYGKNLPWYDFIIIPLRFLLLNSTMIPISLKVTLDLCKLYYAKFVEHDAQLIHEPTDYAVHANSSALGEDLGQVHQIMSDKTGTLTDNVMLVKACSINGTVFGQWESSSLLNDSPVTPEAVAVDRGLCLLDDPQLLTTLRNASSSSTFHHGVEMFRCLAVNNCVLPADMAGTALGMVYKASSPDEEALVKAAAAYKIQLMARENGMVRIQVFGRPEVFQILHEFEFSSERKRMSVVVRVPGTNQLRMYSKGADEVMMPLLVPGAANSAVQQQVDAFASFGLRTLIIAYRDIPQHVYDQWAVEFHQANTAMADREAKKWVVYTKLERELCLLGATAIEDKLQDGVPATIQLLKSAGIKFWMITGDKPTTALTIARTCNLMPKGNHLITLDAVEPDAVTRQIEHHLQQVMGPNSIKVTPPPKGRPVSSVVAAPTQFTYTLMVKGGTLDHALVNDRATIGELFNRADSIIACRVTPAQKAQLVQLVKEQGQQTLAIGDGGNDVSMIQTAHVGVGIRGKEGLQASRASDYSVGMFRVLQRLVLVHGRWAYYRTALVAQYSFYKSLMFCFMQIGYSFAVGFSGTSMFNSLCVAAYNAILFVPIVYFFVDKDVSEETIFRYPQTYQLGTRSMRMNWRTCAWWALRALYQAIAMMIIGVYAASATKSASGYETMGLVQFAGYLWVQDLTMLFELRRVTVYNMVAIFGLHVFAIVCALVANYVVKFSSFIDYYTLSVELADPVFWLVNILQVFACILPVLAWKTYSVYFEKSMESELLRRDLRIGNSRRLSERPLMAGSASPSQASPSPRFSPDVEMSNPALGLSHSTKSVESKTAAPGRPPHRNSHGARSRGTGAAGTGV